MVSQVNPNVPVQGNPTTASVRANFATAQSEISALQVNTQGAPFLPTAGGAMTGALTLAADPTALMHPVTLGYFNSHGGGGGTGGIPEAPSDSTLYGRQNAAWVHAVGTTELNNAINTAPFVALAGSTMTGLLTLSGPPTANLHASTKAYADTKLALAGGTLTGPLVLAADPTQALGAATKQYIDNQHFIPQTGASSINCAVVDCTNAADHGPTLTGYVTPYNATSAYFQIQPVRYTTAQAGGQFSDGASVTVFGPSHATQPNQVAIYAGNNTAGFKAWSFLTDGSSATPTTGVSRFNNSRVVSQGAASTNPSIAVYDTAQGYGGGMFLGASQSLYFASMNSAGVFQTIFAGFTSTGAFNIGNSRALNDPLTITTASGYNARIIFQVAALRQWIMGCMASDGSFQITDSTGGAQRLSIIASGATTHYSSGSNCLSVLQGWGIRFDPAGATYATGNAFSLGWGSVTSNLVTVTIDNAAQYALANASDERMKFDIAPSSLDCLATVLELPLAEYRWADVDDPNNLRGRRQRPDARLNRVGMIAQRVHRVFPEGVMQGDTFDRVLGRVWQLDQNNMLALGFGAIQQLAARVAALEGKGS